MSAAMPLIGRDGKWISAAAAPARLVRGRPAGSVSVKEGAKSTAYVFVDANGHEQANATQYLGNLSEA